jgi:hypothetical protein
MANLVYDAAADLCELVDYDDQGNATVRAVLGGGSLASADADDRTARSALVTRLTQDVQTLADTTITLDAAALRPILLRVVRCLLLIIRYLVRRSA